MYKYGLIRYSNNPESIARRERRDRQKGKVIGSGGNDQNEERKPPHVLQPPKRGRKKTVVSEEQEQKYKEQLSVHALELVQDLMTDMQGSQSQLVAPIVHRLAIERTLQPPSRPL